MCGTQFLARKTAYELSSMKIFALAAQFYAQCALKSKKCHLKISYLFQKNLAKDLRFWTYAVIPLWYYYFTLFRALCNVCSGKPLIYCVVHSIWAHFCVFQSQCVHFVKASRLIMLKGTNSRRQYSIKVKQGTTEQIFAKVDTIQMYATFTTCPKCFKIGEKK